MTLPLRATAFERYMRKDDRPSHPMTYTIRLKFLGQIDRAAFDAAVDRGVRRHPLLCAHLVGDRPSQLTWVQASNPFPYVDYGDEAKPLRFPGTEQIDLRTHTGLRIWVRSGDERTEMRFQFHHCCCDGLGAYRLIEDVLCAYHMALCPDDHDVTFRPLDPELLAARMRFGLAWWRVLLRMPLEIWGAVMGMAMFLLLRPQPLLSPERPVEEEADSPPLLDVPAHTFAADESNRLRDAARAAGATMNDLLLRDLLLAMHEWNESLDPRIGGRLMRVMIPINLRSAGDEVMPAANVIGMVNLDRWLKWYRNPARLLTSIAWETRILQYFRFALAFIRCIALLERIPGGLEFMTRTNRCYATSVLSNLGRILGQAPLPRREGKLVAGGLLLESIESAPPVRSFVATGLTCLYYCGRLTLVQNYDRHYFTPQAAAQLMALTVRQILKSAGPGVEQPATLSRPTALASTSRPDATNEGVAPATLT